MFAIGQRRRVDKPLLYRSESFAMTAFKNLPPWEDFQKGQDSDMLRMRERYTEMLDRKQTETLANTRSFRSQKRRMTPTRCGGNAVKGNPSAARSSLSSIVCLAQHAPNTVGRRLTEYLLPSVAAAISGNQNIHQVPGRKD